MTLIFRLKLEDAADELVCTDELAGTDEVSI